MVTTDNVLLPKDKLNVSQGSAIEDSVWIQLLQVNYSLVASEQTLQSLRLTRLIISF